MFQGTSVQLRLQMVLSLFAESLQMSQLPSSGHCHRKAGPAAHLIRAVGQPGSCRAWPTGTHRGWEERGVTTASRLHSTRCSTLRPYLLGDHNHRGWTPSEAPALTRPSRGCPSRPGNGTASPSRAAAAPQPRVLPAGCSASVRGPCSQPMFSFVVASELDGNIHILRLFTPRLFDSIYTY